MLRRIYVMPLNSGVSQAAVEELLADLIDTDRFIPGLLDSSAAVDLATETVIWEMMFADEEAYTGPYMTHPYHMATLDNYLISDSPERLVHDSYTVRYTLPGSPPRIERGIRRVVLLKLPEGTDIAALEAIAVPCEGMATSVFSPENVAWQYPGKSPRWTHVWEQTFTDMDSLEDYLKSPKGIAGSRTEGFRRRGVDVLDLRILTYPFELKSDLSLPPPTEDDGPILYVVTVRVLLENVDEYVRLLEQHYDPVLASLGSELVHRWKSIENGYREVEILSTWLLPSSSVFDEFRAMTVTNVQLNHFIVNGMPLVRGGVRRFYRAA